MPTTWQQVASGGPTDSYYRSESDNNASIVDRWRTAGTGNGCTYQFEIRTTYPWGTTKSLFSQAWR